MKTLSRRAGRILTTLVLVLGLSAVTARGTKTPDELDALLATIALYPDALLFQVLAAAEYPLDVVRAERWARNHPHQSGEAAVQAAANENWDPSVQALVAFPHILSRMSGELEWTEQSVLYARFHWGRGHMMINVGHPPARTPYAWHRPPAPRPVYRPRPAPRHPVREPRMSRHPSPRVGTPSPSPSRTGRGRPDEYRRRPEPDRSRRGSGGSWEQTWGVSRTRSWEQTWGENRNRTWDRTWDRSGESRDDTPRGRRR